MSSFFTPSNCWYGPNDVPATVQLTCSGRTYIPLSFRSYASKLFSIRDEMGLKEWHIVANYQLTISGYASAAASDIKLTLDQIKRRYGLQRSVLTLSDYLWALKQVFYPNSKLRALEDKLHKHTILRNVIGSNIMANWEHWMLRIRDDAYIIKASDETICTALRGLVSEMPCFDGKWDTVERTKRPHVLILPISSVLSRQQAVAPQEKVFGGQLRSSRSKNPSNDAGLTVDEIGPRSWLPAPRQFTRAGLTEPAIHAANNSFDYNKHEQKGQFKPRCCACKSEEHKYAACPRPDKEALKELNLARTKRVVER
jgi:hypothetical protein